MILTEPNTPLDDADHVGSFDLRRVLFLSMLCILYIEFVWELV